MNAYTMFLSNGDSIHINITKASTSICYRNYDSMPNYDVFVKEVCSRHKVIETQDFEKVVDDYEIRKDTFFNAKRKPDFINLQ